MTLNEKRIAKKFAKKIKKQAIKDWIKTGNFDEWFWDRVNEYYVKDNEREYIDNLFKKWVDK